MSSPKKTKVTKPRHVSTHPRYREMIIAAIKSQEEKKGSSRVFIRKYIEENFDVKQQGFTTHLNRNLKKLIESEFLFHPKTSPGCYKIKKAELTKEKKEAKAKAKAAIKKQQAKEKLEKEKSKQAQKKQVTKKIAKKKTDAPKKESVKKTTKSIKSKETSKPKKSNNDFRKTITKKKVGISKKIQKKTAKKSTK
uniref:histone H1-delta-like n=1 Tax=Styela clava TaxID=7725 RepID=UPI001939681B|nr:histone H1-delta-like [Styela clava]